MVWVEFVAKVSRILGVAAWSTGTTSPVTAAVYLDSHGAASASAGWGVCSVAAVVTE